MGDATVSAPALGERSSGVLLHPTSLPGPHGCGDLGEGARRFADFLAAAGQRWWQMLPVAPPGYGDSPYSAESAFAGSPLLVDLAALSKGGLLAQSDLAGGEALPEGKVDYAATAQYRDARLRAAAEAFALRIAAKGTGEGGRFERFCRANRRWLEDYALYRALKRARGGAPWTAWEPALRDRKPKALQAARDSLRAEIAQHRFEQYAFAEQWRALREYCAARGIGLLGDLPIFVAHDSADVWEHKELFRLDARGEPEAVAGVPPDYFSATGQRWGNPLYRWDVLRSTDYAWWIDRLRVTLARFDAARIDHFIGFTRYWQIPADCPTAVDGRWVKGPGAHFFRAVRKALGDLPLVAEDLGAVTDEVKALRDRFSLPGMRVLQFAFGDDPSAPDFLPHNYPRNTVVYTGTHDNDTTVGWFNDPGGEGRPRSPAEAERERQTAMDYLASDGREVHWDMIRTALLSVADTAIAPLQDLLGLGSEARMNVPGTTGGDNFRWRFRDADLSPEIAARMARLTRIYGRAPREARP